MNSGQFNIQVSKDHYFEQYDDISRFIAYFYQIDLIRQLKPQNVLEIGVGNKTVSNYLKYHGIKIDTCDFDESLEPDYVADIRNLPFEENSYDAIMACEVLEHIPWEDVDKALSELYRISKKHAIISIPYASASFELIFRFPLIGRLLNRTLINLFFRMPFFFSTIEFSGEHYWEMGRRNYSSKKIRKAFGKYFKIIKEVRPILISGISWHYFFILEKKQNAAGDFR